MQYRRFGATGIEISVLGLGTTRFRTATDQECENSVQLVCRALTEGVNIVDVAPAYSQGKAESILAEGIRRTGATPHVTFKLQASDFVDTDTMIKRVRQSLDFLGLQRFTFFVCWSIMSYDEFSKIVAHGGLYQSALYLKQLALVEHITFSTHASSDDVCKIMDSGYFEGVTISMNTLNYKTMKPIVERAGALDLGICVMNPLGGGLIPQNDEFFSFLKSQNDRTASAAALRYLLAHNEITCLLSGVSNEFELNENLDIAEQSDPNAANRVKTVEAAVESIGGFCHGCRYCDGCPEGINVSDLMQAYNSLLFPIPKQAYGRTDRHLIGSIGICSKLKNTLAFIPPDDDNPCVACARCEKKCTAKLPIIERISELYARFKQSGFSYKAMRERLVQLIGLNRRIAFYPGAGYTAFVLKILREALPDAEFEITLFDGNKQLWGTKTSGIEVQSPDRIREISPEIIIVSNYNYADEIYESIKHYKNEGIDVVKLHQCDDVPWVF